MCFFRALDEQVWCKAVNKASAAKEQAEALKQTNRMSSKTIMPKRTTMTSYGTAPDAFGRPSDTGFRDASVQRKRSAYVLSDIGHVRANGRNSHTNTLVRLRTFRMSLTSP